MATNRREILLDEFFSVPPGVVDVRQEAAEDREYLYTPETQPVDVPTIESPTSTIPSPPTSYRIISQTIRTGEDKTKVVDVILVFPEVDGVFDINIRAIKE